jgi:hypothetical protein
MSGGDDDLNVSFEQDKHREQIQTSKVLKGVGMGSRKAIIRKVLAQDIPLISRSLRDGGGFGPNRESISNARRPHGSKTSSRINGQRDFGIRIDRLMGPNAPIPKGRKFKPPDFAIFGKRKIVER